MHAKYLPYWMIAPVVLAVIAFVVGPTADVFSLSFTKFVMGMPQGSGGLSNFTKLFDDPQFASVLKNTAVWIVGGTLSCVIAGLAVATYLSIDSKLTAVMRALILLPWILPDVVTAMAWKWMLHGQVGVIGNTLVKLGLTDRPPSFLGDPSTVMWTLVAVVVWRKMPLVALILCAAIRSVPEEYYEASKIDGASKLQQFRFIVMPHIAFSLTAVSVISMVWITAEFTLPWVMTGGGPANSSQIMATYIYQQSFQFFNWGSGAAMSVVNLVMLLGLVSLYLYTVRKSWSAVEK